ncbi:MAG: hypothetical protein K6C07_04870 [Bacteroidales bacterium]|nr:hypothetical protein [Bacteroidales bacterium]
MKLFKKILILSCFLVPVVVQGQQSQADGDGCKLLERVLDHSLFKEMPFSLVDTVYVYEEGENLFSPCGVFANPEGKFHYSWSQSERGWFAVAQNDSQLFAGVRKMIRATDTVLFYRTSLLVTLSVRQGKQSMMAFEDESRHRLRYRLCPYRKYVTVWVVWKRDPVSPVNEVAALTYRKKKGEYILVAYGRS